MAVQSTPPENRTATLLVSFSSAPTSSCAQRSLRSTALGDKNQPPASLVRSGGETPPRGGHGPNSGSHLETPASMQIPPRQNTQAYNASAMTQFNHLQDPHRGTRAGALSMLGERVGETKQGHYRVVGTLHKPAQVSQEVFHHGRRRAEGSVAQLLGPVAPQTGPVRGFLH